MKKRKITFKNIIALSLAFILVLASPCGSLHTFAAPAETPDIEDEAYTAPGIMPELSVGKTDISPEGDALNQSYLSAYALDDTYGDYFDSRESNIITPVRNQGGYSSCWCFATLGAMEANLVKNGYADVNSVDLSELQLAYYSYCTNLDPENTGLDPLGLSNGDYTNFVSTGETYLSLGGNVLIAANTLMNRVGAVSEETVPYTWATAGNHRTLNLDIDNAYSKDIYHLKSYHIADMTDKETVKQFIVDYGAVASAFCSEREYYGTSDEYRGSYFSGTAVKVTNHAVTIVGWDDNYPIEAFDTKPSRPGAWIIKNSWGTNDYKCDEDGYIYISYEEGSMNNSGVSAVAFEALPVDSRSNNYYYDGSTPNLYLTLSRDYDIAAVFETKDDIPEKITSVSVATLSPGIQYEMKVFDNPDEKNGVVIPDSGELVYSTEGVLEYAGYTSLPVPGDIIAEKGHRISIKVTFFYDEEKFPKGYLIPVSQTYTGDAYKCINTKPENSTFWKTHTYPNWSYYRTEERADGEKEKMYDRDVRLRLFTEDIPLSEVPFEAARVQDKVEMSFDIPETGYEKGIIQRAGSDGKFEDIYTFTDMSVNSFTDESVLPGESYTYRLWLTCEGRDESTEDIILQMPEAFELTETVAPKSQDFFYGQEVGCPDFANGVFTATDGVDSWEVTAGTYETKGSLGKEKAGDYELDYSFTPASVWYKEISGKGEITVKPSEPEVNLSAEIVRKESPENTEDRDTASTLTYTVDVTNKYDSEIVPESIRLLTIPLGEEEEILSDGEEATLQDDGSYLWEMKISDIIDMDIRGFAFKVISDDYVETEIKDSFNFSDFGTGFLNNCLTGEASGETIIISFMGDEAFEDVSLQVADTAGNYVDLGEFDEEGTFTHSDIMPDTEYTYRVKATADRFSVKSEVFKITSNEALTITEKTKPDVQEMQYGMKAEGSLFSNGVFEAEGKSEEITEGEYAFVGMDEIPAAGQYDATYSFTPDSPWYKAYNGNISVNVKKSTPELVITSGFEHRQDENYLKYTIKVQNAFTENAVPDDLVVLVSAVDAKGNNRNLFTAEKTGNPGEFVCLADFEKVLLNEIVRLDFSAVSESYEEKYDFVTWNYDGYTANIAEDSVLIFEGETEKITTTLLPAGSQGDWYAVSLTEESDLITKRDENTGEILIYEDDSADYICSFNPENGEITSNNSHGMKEFMLFVRNGYSTDSVKIRLYAPQDESAVSVRFETEDGEEFTGRSCVYKAGDSFIVKGIVENLNREEVSGRMLTWTSSDTGVATVKRISGNTVKVMINSPGVCRIGATAGNENGLVKYFTVTSIDPKPVLSRESFTVNKQMVNPVSEELELSERTYGGVTFAHGDLSVTGVSLGSKTLNADTFVIQKTLAGNYRIALNEAYADTIKTGTYFVTVTYPLQDVVNDEKAGITENSGTYTDVEKKIKIKVKNTTPKVTLSSVKINLFDKNTYSSKLDADCVLGEVKEITVPDDSMITFEKNEYDGSFSYSFTPGEKTSLKKLKKVTVNALVTVEGYKPFNMNISAKCSYSAPKIKQTGIPKLTVTDGYATGTKVILSEGANANITILSDKSGLGTDESFTGNDGSLFIFSSEGYKYKNGKTVSLKLSLSRNNWVSAVPVTVKAVVYKSAPKVTSKVKSFTFNTNLRDEAGNSEKYLLPVKSNRTDSVFNTDVSTFKFEVKKSGSKKYVACDESNKPEIAFEDGAYTISAPDLSKGTYNYRIGGFLIDYPKVSLTLKVKVQTKAVSVKTTVKGSVNIINRENSKATGTFKISGTSCPVEAVSFTDGDVNDSRFDIFLTDSKKFVIKAKEGVEIPKGKITAPIEVTISGGVVCDSFATFTVTDTGSSLKTPKTVTVHKSYGKKNVYFDFNDYLSKGYETESLTVVSCPGGLMYETGGSILCLGLRDSMVKDGTYTVEVRGKYKGGEKYFTRKVKIKIAE